MERVDRWTVVDTDTYIDANEMITEQIRTYVPPTYLPNSLLNYQPASKPTYLPHLPTYLPTHPPTTYLPTYQGYLPTYLPTYPSTLGCNPTLRQIGYLH